MESRRTLAFDQGYLVRQGEEPQTAPLLYRGEWVTLSDSGAVIEWRAA